MPRPKSTTRRVRLNLDMAECVRDQLEKLRLQTRAESMAEVIRRALAVYDLVIDERAKGGAIILRHADGKEETLVML